MVKVGIAVLCKLAAVLSKVDSLLLSVLGKHYFVFHDLYAKENNYDRWNFKLK